MYYSKVAKEEFESQSTTYKPIKMEDVGDDITDELEVMVHQDLANILR